jgi:hypothetical protein
MFYSFSPLIICQTLLTPPTSAPVEFNSTLPFLWNSKRGTLETADVKVLMKLDGNYPLLPVIT